MQTRNRNTFTTIHTEGALLPVDLLQRISENDANLEGLRAESYHLAPGEKLNEAINRSWNRLNGLWGAFQTAHKRLAANDAGTTITRERWLLPLFQEMGFGRLSIAKAVEIEGKSYPISHRWQNVPLHLVGCGLDLNTRTPGVAGASRTSPHSLLQEYLNRSDDAQWGILSNGLGLRILRDNATLTRQAYLEFDLEAMFEGEVYSDFVLLWLTCHQSRFETGEKQPDCILERWSKSAQESGTRALDDLRRGVEEAIVSLGQGFLQHPQNSKLRAGLKQGELSAQDYYRQLLRLVYRLIFLFAAEDRDLLLHPEASTDAKKRFQNYYSTTRLRALAEKQRGSRHHDRYEALRLVMTLLGSEKGCPELAIPALGGFLFDGRSTEDLNDAKLDNQSLLAAVRSLAFITEGNIRRAVDYRNLGPEELGSVYESLLELHPILNTDAGTFQLMSTAGNERKTTGSYYTPSSLIRVLLDSALEPVIEDRLKGKTDAAQQEQALLAIKVCDPACGSGHFLIAAAHRIAGRLAQARAGGDEPSPKETRRALRDVIRNCIYGVDVNPMAVELCKVNLWLESLEPGKPLSFLDAHIQCGDSLVGVGPGLDISEIPDEAFNPAFGDDKATASALKKRNKRERSGQLGFRWNVTGLTSPEDLACWRAERVGLVEAMPEDDPVQVQAKAQAFEQYQQAQEYIQNRLEYDMWTTAFFWPIPKGDAEHMIAPTHQELKLLRSDNIPDVALVKQVRRLADMLNFFHWELAFPKVFSGDNPGFDCVLGNPPWEMLQLEEQEFFATRDPEIFVLPVAQRKKAIVELVKINPLLAQEFQIVKHHADALNKYLRESKRFPLTAVGRMNTYILFAEHFRKISSEAGQLGVILPTGIVTDDTPKFFFSDIVTKRALVKIVGFENEAFIFPAVHHSFRFCLLVIAGKGKIIKEFDAVFFCRYFDQVKETERHFQLTSKDILLINPNTGTMPIFRTRSDAVLTLKLYERVPVLEEENKAQNYWGISISRIFNMGIPETYRLCSPIINGNIPNNHLRMIEAKLFHQYDHRWATYKYNEPEEVPVEEKEQFNYISIPKFSIPANEVIARIGVRNKRDWLFAFRDITSAITERSSIATILPFSGTDMTIRLLFNDFDPQLVSCLLGNFNSLVFDYVVRQKLAGNHLSDYITKQLPVLPPGAYTSTIIEYVSQRVLELVYTTNDLRPYAEDMDYHSKPFCWNEDRRALLRAELDAYYAHLYGLNRKQLRYILDPADLTPRELEDILAPWEEVVDPLDPAGYDARRSSSDFPGETFRVLKEKEIKQYGEYRTRRLVLEAWERLETNGELPEPAHERTAPPAHRRESITLTAQPAPLSKREEPPAKPAPQSKVKAAPEDQPTLSDFGLYKCEICGKMVMGFEKTDHEQEKHRSQTVEWKKVR